MTFSDFIKTTEALVVLIGLFLTLTLGKFWAIATAGAYIFLNVPSLWSWIMSKFQK